MPRKDTANGKDKINAPPNTTSMDKLQTGRYREVLEKLRECGLHNELPLPQLVVCGDQSSGKSSVLEAITEVPFPRNENMCTRFATEIILRADSQVSITTKIIPDSQLPAAERIRLEGFNKAIKDFSELLKLIEEATAFMELNIAKDKCKLKAFSRNVLRIELKGPTMSELTLVDLPGIVHSENKHQTADDVQLIKALVWQYLAQRRTIVLAVVSAKNDYANQGILNECKAVDPLGKRTLGIITKPDFLVAGSKSETEWIDLAQNGNIKFELGWHVLKNRSDQEAETNTKARNDSERRFFSSGAWKSLPQHMKGIGSLRERLSLILFEHIKVELPSVEAEINAELHAARESIQRLGDRRTTPAEQRSVLTNISVRYSHIVNSAIAGTYDESTFFGTNDKSEAVDPRFLRAAVIELGTQFSSQMLRYGHKYHIQTAPGIAGTNFSRDHQGKLHPEYEKASKSQSTRTRPQAVQWVAGLHTATRGWDLPGTFNSTLITRIFQEQSENWPALAEAHLRIVEGTCSKLVGQAVAHVAPPGLVKNITAYVDGILDERYKNAQQELDRLDQDNKRSVMIYDPSYGQMVQSLQDHGSKVPDSEVPDSQISGSRYSHHGAYGQASTTRAPPKPNTGTDNISLSAETALNHLIASYDKALDVRVANVPNQVIERHLVDNLAAATFSPMMIGAMSDEAIATLAAEPIGITRDRERLERRKAVLESGKKVFSSALYPLKRHVDAVEEGAGGEGVVKRLGPARRSLIAA